VSMAEQGGALRQLGGILVDVERIGPNFVQSYLLELRDRLGPTVPFDIRAEARELADPPQFVRWHKAHARVLTLSCVRAAERGHLVVLFAPILPDAAVIQGLLQAFELDELVGFTQPRFSDATSDAIWFLPEDTDRSPGRLPRQSLPLLPETYLTTEQLAGCVAVRREVAATISMETERTENLAVALLHEMRNARRRGYRTLVLNRLIVPTESLVTAYPLHQARSQLDGRARSLRARSEDEWFNGGVHRRRELLIARARRARPTEKVAVLLDCRGVVGHHNGTSAAVFGLLDGLGLENPEWDIELLFSPAAAEYHRVASRFPSMHLSTTLPDRHYAAAICLNQPWHLSTVNELHQLALVIAFNVLDTIAWDVVYLANPEVDRVWHFIAEHADGLLYISAFTRGRFNFRFRVAPSVREAVTYLSLAPEDYRDSRATALPQGDHILVFGNHYDHKAVAPTVELLSRAFPYQRIEAMGAKAQSHHNVTVLQSGHLPAGEIDRLIATARVVVFPSHYEGFGLPVVKALSYGRTVVVRSSSLWREIAGLMRMPGQLVAFVTPHDLVRAVGQVLNGEHPDALSLGEALVEGEPPPGWRQSARRLVTLVEGALAGPDAQKWYARDRSLALAHP
jgi:glycosyltransferase involved in cell wall biosynthesis